MESTGGIQLGHRTELLSEPWKVAGDPGSTPSLSFLFLSEYPFHSLHIPVPMLLSPYKKWLSQVSKFLMCSSYSIIHTNWLSELFHIPGRECVYHNLSHMSFFDSMKRPTPNSKVCVWGGGGVPHTSKEFSSTSWVSYNATPFWYYLPGSSIRLAG